MMRILGCVGMAGLLLLTACKDDHWTYELRQDGPGRQYVGGLAAYVLGPGDTVRVTVFREPAVSGEFVVDPGGYIGVPLVGQVRVAGSTAAQAQRKIASLFHDDYIKDATVTVDVTKYRPFYILGEVRKAGAYPYAPNLTVADAVALAGGYTYRANERWVYIRHVDGLEEKVYDRDTDVVGRIPLYPGDNVRIPERYF